MNRLLTILILSLLCSGLYAQTPACCTSATRSFAAFASDKSFNSQHEIPLPYRHNSDIGKDITFPVEDGQAAHAYELRAQKPSPLWLFVFHEWWGLNDHIKKEAEKLYKDLGGKVNVLALDLYDRQVATTREEAAQLMQSAQEARIRSIIRGAAQYAGKKAHIATIGWCFGGGWSMQAALMLGKQAHACIIYYGMPEQNIEKLKSLRAPVLGIFATQDRWINPEVVKAFEQAMKAAGKALEVYSYDADHAFANPSNPHYQSEATAQAYDKTLKFLQRHLLGKD
ncbi:carboxymethylenebutenolidase [Thermonema lapsum]|uniref:Carboxymethylenebutenolidase n=1 Tax=Thermonema lapsum TaxID=28195 RepID=A0A846MR41_9BACT|nr:dienelactone hydrolase family protein [Thermonema lapsum]NIK73842.1 carboxymethylenebutenolidase [Thermonema lapsum]